jgi:hypothetical protein
MIAQQTTQFHQLHKVLSHLRTQYINKFNIGREVNRDVRDFNAHNSLCRPI